MRLRMELRNKPTIHPIIKKHENKENEEEDNNNNDY